MVQGTAPVTRTPMWGMVCQFEAAVTLFHP